MIIGSFVSRKGEKGSIVGFPVIDNQQFIEINFGSGSNKSFSLSPQHSLGLTFEDPEAEKEFNILRKKELVRENVKAVEKMKNTAENVVFESIRIGGISTEDFSVMSQLADTYKGNYEQCCEILRSAEKAVSDKKVEDLLRKSQVLLDSVKASEAKINDADIALKTHSRTDEAKDAVVLGHSGRIAFEKKLERGTKYGKTNKDIFSEGCKTFGWDEKHFSSRRGWASNATPEGYDVWFIVNSQLGENVPSANGFFNKISDDYIVESWTEDKDKNIKEESCGKRVVFAKDRENNGYVFLGVFEFDNSEADFVNRKRKHRLISDQYSLINNTVNLTAEQKINNFLESLA